MVILKDFWFPLFLAAFGGALSMVGLAVEGSARRHWLAAAVVLWAGAALAAIYGDPVRGPFYGLTHPSAKDQFTIHAGITMRLPVKGLKDGIDFTKVFAISNDPIQLFVKRTWWSGRRCDLKIKTDGGQFMSLIENNKVTGEAPIGTDRNFDDTALEIVNGERLPVLQVIWEGEDDVYINAVITNGTIATILKDSKLTFKPIASLTPNDLATRIFKYPSYANRGKRE
jgi:hypothetical protein